MTTEDEFQAMLDANPRDWQTRLVFADWLQERDDLRAEGYRALGVNRMRAPCSWPTWFSSVIHGETAGKMPDDWFSATVGVGGFHELQNLPGSSELMWVDYNTRREAEDTATRGFVKLPAERRAEILAGESS